MTYNDIRKANLDDIETIKHLADSHRKELGFIRRSTLAESIAKSEVLVAQKDKSIIGFLYYHHRRDQQTTIYSIVVCPKYRSLGYGRNMMQSLIMESKQYSKGFVLLKCPIDLKANGFYKTIGFDICKVQSGKKRKLNIWQIDLLICSSKSPL